MLTYRITLEIILNTQQSSPEELVDVILKYLKEKNKI